MVHNRAISLYRVFLTFALLAAGALLPAQVLLGDSFDWRNVNGANWNTTVKSQFGGTCWDFSTTGSLEAKYMITRNDPSFVPDLSEQQNCWETTPDLGGTGGGGGFDIIAAYFTTHGDVSETECPVEANSLYQDAPKSGDPWPLATGWQNRVWKSASYQVNIANTTSVAANTAILKNAIKTAGPVFLDINPADLYKSVAALRASNYVYSPGGGHAVSLIGFCDDATCPTGGYWIIKNSWGVGEGDNGYDYLPYGSSVEGNHCQNTLGAVYYTGPMYHTGAWDATGVDHTGTAATNTWKGTASATWDTTSATSTNWSNNSTGTAFTWVNQELQAVFDSTGSHKAITVSGTVIAHGLTFNAGGTGYSFTGGSLTVTAGGIQANESVTFSSPLYIGGPQSWNVASGKTLTVSGALHTIVSDLTFNGAGTTLVSGQLDGGGTINIFGGAKPGGLIQSGAGTVTLNNTLDYAGDITASGTGPLNISPTGAGSIAYSGAYFGGGTINVACSGVFTLGGGASNFSGTLNMLQPGTLHFVPAAGIASTFSGPINSAGSIVQDGPGTTVLSGTNNYTGGTTTISNGALQATIGTGIPSASFLKLDGGVLQSNGNTTFSRSIGTSGTAFEWTANGGGFAAGAGTMTVKVNNNITTPLTWGTDSTSQIVGTLKFGSTTAANAVTFQNYVNLSGADRTIEVDDNPNLTADLAVMSGNITGTGGIVKTGDGLLKLSGANTYSGTTTIAGGILQATIGTGIPSSSFLYFNGGALQFNNTSSFTYSLGASGANTVAWGLGGGGFSAGSAALTVNIGNQTTPTTLVWGNSQSDIGTKLLGPLTLNATTASNSLTFKNNLDLNGGARTIAAGANSVYLPGNIIDSVGGGSLTKTGTATLYIQGSSGNSYTGLTTILGGDVYLSKTSGYAIPGDLTLGGNTQIFVSVQQSNQIASTSKWSWCGTGGWQEIKLFGHSQTVAGLCDAAGQGVVENTWGESNYSALTFTINNSTDCSFRGTIRDTCSGTNVGAVSIIKTGTGSQTLAGGQISYTGSTTISQGTLVLQDITDASLCARSVSNSGTLGLSSVNTAFTFTGVVSGTGSLKVIGGNWVTLAGSNANTYTGTTTISDGKLILAKTAGVNAIPGDFTIVDDPGYVVVHNPNQFPTTAKVTFAGTGNPHFEVYGNTVTVGGISTSGGAEIENTEGETGVANGTLVVNNSANCSFSGTIRDNAGGSGNIALVKSGPGTLTFTGSDCGSYTGGLTVNAGTLDYSAGTLPNCNYTITGGTVNIGSRSASMKNFQITGGTITGTGTLTSNAAYDIQAGVVGVNLAGSGIALNKTTAGTAILTGSDTYTGATTISAGTLQLGNGGSSGSLANTTGIAVGAGATFDVNRSSAGGTLTFRSIVSGTGTLVKDGTGVVAMATSNSFSGNLVVNNGTLNYSTNSTLPAGNYTIAGGTLNTGALSKTIGTFQITGGSVTGTGTLTSNAAYDVEAGTVSAILGGSVGLNKTGSGAATVSSPTYTGTTNVSTGTLTFSGALPGGNYAVSGGTLNTGSLSKSIGAFQITGGAVTGTGTLTSNAAYDVEAGMVSAILGGSVGLNKTGPGLATVSSPTYTGTTNVSAGTLTFSGALPGGNYAVSGGTLNTGALSKTIGTFQITGGAVTGTTGVLTSNAAYDVEAGTVGAILAGSSIGMNKSTSAAAILTGANTYGGLTTVSGGTLELGTAAARHPVFDLGGADIQNDWSKLVFDYTGPSDDPAAQIGSILTTSYGPVGGHPFSAVNGGKIFSSAAESAGKALGWSDNGTNQVTVMYTMNGDTNLDGAVDFSDLTSVLANYDSPGTWATGDFNYDGVVDFSDLTSVLANYDQSLSGLVVNGSSLDAQAVGQLTADGVKVVPEPGTLALLAAGLIGLLACGWRSRR